MASSPSSGGDLEQLVIRDAADADRARLLMLWRELMEVHAATDARFTLAEDADRRFLDYVDTARSRDDYRVRVAVLPRERPRRRRSPSGVFGRSELDGRLGSGRTPSEAGWTNFGVCGFTIACVLPNTPMYRTRWIGYINDVCVTASLRGRGVGRALVRDAVNWACDHGAESIELYVAKANAPAGQFWRSVGAQDYLERMSLDLSLYGRGPR